MIEIGSEVQQILKKRGHEAVAYRTPLNGELFLSGGDVVWTATHDYDSTSHRLILRPIPPRMVPLGPEDIVPGTVVRFPTWSPWYYEFACPNERGDQIYRSEKAGGSSMQHKFSDLQRDGWLYKTPAMTEWAKCEKPAP